MKDNDPSTPKNDKSAFPPGVKIESPRRSKKAVDAIVADLIENMVDIPGSHFKMCKYACTQALWKAVMDKNPSRYPGSDRPVECVSYNDCEEFLRKLNSKPEVKKAGIKFRLPYEEEWKHACRAGGSGNYCKLSDGSEIMKETLGHVAWYDDNSDGKTHPVGQKESNAFGLYDMIGNVAEWTESASDGNYLVCGGDWSSDVCECGCDSDIYYDPEDQFRHIGFRLIAFEDSVFGSYFAGDELEP